MPSYWTIWWAIWGGNFGRNGLTWPYNIKNDMNREKIELSEYLNRFGAYNGAFWDIVCRKLLILLDFYRFFDISGTITVPDVTRFSQNDCASCRMSRSDRTYSYKSLSQRTQSVFWLFSPFPGFPIRDVTDQKIFPRFLIRWTAKTLTIQNMYSFMGIRTI